MEVVVVDAEEQCCPYCQKKFIQKDGCITNNANRRKHMNKCAKIHAPGIYDLEFNNTIHNVQHLAAKVKAGRLHIPKDLMSHFQIVVSLTQCTNKDFINQRKMIDQISDDFKKNGFALLNWSTDGYPVRRALRDHDAPALRQMALQSLPEIGLLISKL